MWSCTPRCLCHSTSTCPSLIQRLTRPPQSIQLRYNTTSRRHSTTSGDFPGGLVNPTSKLSELVLTRSQVHKSVLLKAEWFRKALLGSFLEAEAQSLDLPEEDPAIFHFLVAYLYEERYLPTKPLSSVLVLDPDKGKGKDLANDMAHSDSDSDGLSWHSDSSAQSRRRQERRRRRRERQLERLRQKHPGAHRPNCTCPQCVNSSGPP